MSEQETEETVKALATTEPRKSKSRDGAKAKSKTNAKSKTKSKSKAKAPRPKAEKPASPAQDFDFVGRVESLRVKSGAGPEGFEFGLRGRHGKRRSFRFDAADAFAVNAMAHLVLAAHASDTKIGVRTAAEVEGVLIVRELESRPKLGKTD